MTRKLVIALLFVSLPFLFACYAGPNPTDHPWALHGHAGLQSPDSSEIDNSYGAGLSGSVHLWDYVSLELGGIQSETDYNIIADGTEPDVDVNETYGHALVKVNFTKDTPLRPYIGAGPNYIAFSSSSIENDSTLADRDFEGDFGWTGVLGLETHLGKPDPLEDRWRHWYIFGEVWRVLNDPDIEGTTASGTTVEFDDDHDAWYFIFGIKRRF